MNVGKNYQNSTLGFIVGSGRSGTTVFTKILNSHSKILAPTAEQLFLISFLNHYKNKHSYTEEEINFILDNLWNLLSINKYIWNINEETLKNDLLAQKDNLPFELLIKIIFRHFKQEAAQNTQTKLFLDKNPFYTYYLNELNNSFTNPKFIFIVRDYRGKYNSVKRVRKHFTKAIGISWKIQQQKILNFAINHPERSLIINYEDLLSHPESALKKVCNFLYLEFEDSMFQFYELSKVGYDQLPVEKQLIDNQLKWHGNSDKPINKNAIDKWKKELTKDEIKVLDYYCGETGKLFGYEPMFKKFSFLDKISIELLHRPLFILIYGFPYLKKSFFYLPVQLQRFMIKTAKKISGIK